MPQSAIVKKDERMPPGVGVNSNAPVLMVKQRELAAVDGEMDKPLRRQCPACKPGMLLMRRYVKTFQSTAWGMVQGMTRLSQLSKYADNVLLWIKRPEKSCKWLFN